MEAIVAFLLAFAFSFMGSIPPGTLNLTIIQLGLEHRLVAARRFAIAAALVEYPYAWLAAVSGEWITTSTGRLNELRLATALVMIMLGAWGILSASKPPARVQRSPKSGFRKGILLGVLNPLAFIYWLGISTYLQGQQWVDLSKTVTLHGYLTGVTLGAFALLFLLAHLARRLAVYVQQSQWLRRLPGLLLVGLGLYALGQYIALAT